MLLDCVKAVSLSAWAAMKHHTTYARSPLWPSIWKARTIPRENGGLSTGWVWSAYNEVQYWESSFLQGLVLKDSPTSKSNRNLRDSYFHNLSGFCSYHLVLVEVVEAGTNFSTPAVTVRRSYVICSAFSSTVADVVDNDVADIFECQ